MSDQPSTFDAVLELFPCRFRGQVRGQKLCTSCNGRKNEMVDFYYCQTNAWCTPVRISQNQEIENICAECVDQEWPDDYDPMALNV